MSEFARYLGLKRRIKRPLPSFFFIVKKKKNNFFVTTIGLDTKVKFNKSCGSIIGIRGSKKYTTVAMESLGKEAFLRAYSYGYKKFMGVVIFRFKVDKFARSFVRGMNIYSRRYMRTKVNSQIFLSHNGMRARKMRRV